MTGAPPPLRVSPGAVAPDVAAELPGLSVSWLALGARPGPSDRVIAARLAALSDRIRGADAVTLRVRPIVAAYRALSRQLGLDPDVARVGAEALAVQRLLHGGLIAGERITDACRLALAETSVPVTALDAAPVDTATLGIRADGGGLVLADAHAVHGPLLGEPVPASAPGRATVGVVLVSVAAPGVPAMAVQEALWLAAEALGAREIP
jgi:hypothetical protein